MFDATVTKIIRRPRFRRAENAPAFQLTDRDVEIVRHVARYRFLRSSHISKLIGASHKKICERLTLLFHAGYLDRPRSQLEYHVRGGGSAPYIYALGKRGSQLLIERGVQERTNVDWARKNRDATRQFLLHTLAIADVRVALTAACQTRQDITLQEPEHLKAALPEETRFARNPWSLRVRVQSNGSVQDIGLLPDYVFALILHDGRRRPFVVECDRGTMPVERSSLNQTSMLRKFIAYEATRQQGIHALRYGWTNFRVLVITFGVQRADTMRALIQQTLALKTSPLFLFTDQASLYQSDFLSNPWLDSGGKVHRLV